METVNSFQGSASDGALEEVKDSDKSCDSVNPNEDASLDNTLSKCPEKSFTLDNGNSGESVTAVSKENIEPLDLSSSAQVLTATESVHNNSVLDSNADVSVKNPCDSNECSSMEVDEIGDKNGCDNNSVNQENSDSLPSKSTLVGTESPSSDAKRNLESLDCSNSVIDHSTTPLHVEAPNLVLNDSNFSTDTCNKVDHSTTGESGTAVDDAASKNEVSKENDDSKQKSFFKLQSDSSSSSESEESESSDSESSVSEESEKADSPRKEGTVRKRFPKDKNKLKGELDIEDLPPIEDLHITVAEDECEPLGKVYSIVNQLVVVESLPNTPALDLDSILFRAKGEPFGQIFDVFGPVKSPYYCVRFNSNSDILSKGIQTGETVYCAPQTEHTKYVFTYQLMQQKGSDASWKHNYEPPPSMIDYSDDEEERKARQRNKKTDLGKVKYEDPDGPQRKIMKSKNWNNNLSAHSIKREGFVQHARPVMLPQPPTFVPPIPVRPPTPGPFSTPPPTRMAPPFESRANKMVNGSVRGTPQFSPHFMSPPRMDRPPVNPPFGQFPPRVQMRGPPVGNAFPPPVEGYGQSFGAEQAMPVFSPPRAAAVAQVPSTRFHANPPFPQSVVPLQSPPAIRSAVNLPPAFNTSRPPPRPPFAPQRPPPFTQKPSYPVFGQQPSFPPSPSPPYHQMPFPNTRPPFP